MKRVKQILILILFWLNFYNKPLVPTECTFPPGRKLSQEQCGINCKAVNSRLMMLIHFKRQQIIDVPVRSQFKGSQKLFSWDLIKWPDSVNNTELGKESPTSIASQIMKSINFEEDQPN